MNLASDMLVVFVLYDIRYVIMLDDHYHFASFCFL